MGKRIIYCADGTWDTAESNTNVYRLFKATTITADQIAFYDDGVGCDGTPLERLLGAAFGLGLYQKIKDGYAKIAHVYQQGDEIFIFGFSRGAFTARSLAGMISVCGLPTHDFGNEALEVAFRAYRDKANRPGLLAKLNASCDMFNAKVTMIGVWDTVGSLGIPALAGKVDSLLYGFLDTSLNPNVLNAYHALAIDEKRCEFPATLWDAPFAPHQNVEQVYFAGCHCDIGGGNPNDVDGSALSDITLAWMMNKAARHGIHFDAGLVERYECPTDPKYALDTINESWSIRWAFPTKRLISPDASISNSVAIRCIEQAHYRPANLQFRDNALADGYRLVDVVKYPAALSASVMGAKN